MATAAGYLAASVLAGLSGVHAYWALGGEWGTRAVIPTRPSNTDAESVAVFTPGARATWAVSSALLTAACVLIGRVRGWNRGPLRAVCDVGPWLVAAAFFARVIGDSRYIGLFKRVRGTPFATRDTVLYVPLSLMVALLSAVAARAPAPSRPVPGPR